MSATQDFIIFILEAYKKRFDLSGLSALELFNRCNVFSYLEKGYDILHTQSIDYVVSEVHELILSHESVSR